MRVAEAKARASAELGVCKLPRARPRLSLHYEARGLEIVTINFINFNSKWSSDAYCAASLPKWPEWCLHIVRLGGGHFERRLTR